VKLAVAGQHRFGREWRNVDHFTAVSISRVYHTSEEEEEEEAIAKAVS
jgi:hypothetical protein